RRRVCGGRRVRRAEAAERYDGGEEQDSLHGRSMPMKRRPDTSVLLRADRLALSARFERRLRGLDRLLELFALLAVGDLGAAALGAGDQRLQDVDGQREDDRRAVAA